MHTFKPKITLCYALLLLLLVLCPLGATGDMATVIVDGTTGVDTQGCGTSGAPCASIQYAIDAYGDAGVTLHVAPGVYEENLEIFNQDVAIQGGYAASTMTSLKGMAPTVIDAGGDGYAVQATGGGNVELTSLTLTNANAWYGAAVRIDWTTVTISDCVITNNQAVHAGGAIHSTGVSGPLTIWNTQIYSNTAVERGGALDIQGNQVAIYDSWITDNHVGGGPGGESGALSVGDNSTVTVRRSVLAGNSAPDHGGMATLAPNASLTLVNCEIAGNTTDSGPASVLANGGGTAEFLNCTVADNAPMGHQAVILWSGDMTSINSIWYNNAWNISNDGDGTVDVSYSLVQGANDMGITMGPGVFDADPMFVGNGSYALQPDSPCVDTGTNTGAPMCDIDGNPRPADGDDDGTATTDIGAHELTWLKLFIPFISNG